MSFARCLSTLSTGREEICTNKKNVVKPTHLLADFFKDRHPGCRKMAILKYNPVTYLNSLQRYHNDTTSYMSLRKLIVTLILCLIFAQFLSSQRFLLQLFEGENRRRNASMRKCFKTKLSLSSNVTLVGAYTSTSTHKARFWLLISTTIMTTRWISQGPLTKQVNIRTSHLTSKTLVFFVESAYI